MGDWQDGQFKFASPEAERQWTLEAYRSGVSAKDWHRGTPIDDKTRDLVLNSLGRPTPPYFRGPDGQYRFGNIHTIEPKEVRDHRLQALRGVKHANLTGPEMPGEQEAVARFAGAAKSAQPTPPAAAANDNARPPAAVPVQVALAPVNTDLETPVTKNATGIGRFAHMAEAQKNAGYLSPEEVFQRIDDGVRFLANGATLGYADNISAAGDAAVMKLWGEDFGPNYEKFLASQYKRTEEAQQRSGTAGVLIESAPQLIPGYGDVVGLGTDLRMYAEDPSKITPGNIGGTLLGILPFVPSVAGTINRIDAAAETAAKVEAKAPDKIGDATDATKLEAEAVPPKQVPENAPLAFDPNDPVALDAYFKRSIKGNEGPDGHVLLKHVGKTKEELLARFQKEKWLSGSSTFHDYQSAEHVIHIALKQHEKGIIEWLGRSTNDLLPIRFRGKEVIGTSVLRNGNVVNQKGATIVLQKDGHGGFHFYTAYPSD